MALTEYLIDTSVIHRRSSSLVVKDAVEKLDAPCRCAIVELEVLYSAVSPADYEQRQSALRDGYRDLPITPQIMQRALEVQRELAVISQHRGITLSDLIIAACAEVHGATVAHYDADYDRIALITGQPMQWVVPAGSVD